MTECAPPTAPGARRLLIVTADDFGLHPAINAAVEQASRAGILTAASLMMAAPATAPAVRLARRLPHLNVGLHVVLADGWATLPRERIPALIDGQGRFANRPWRDGLRYAVSATVRRQLEAEIRAQFQAFAATGLTLDHVNVHKHLHLHPVILNTLLRVGADYGMPAVRLPDEPWWVAWVHQSSPRSPSDAAPVAANLEGASLAHPSTIPPALLTTAATACMTPWVALMKRRLRAAGVPHNDRVFGIAWSGRMVESRLLTLLGRLPPGTNEIYLHPATGPVGVATMRNYRHAEEFAALTSPRVRAALDASDIRRCGYREASEPPTDPAIPHREAQPCT